MSAHHKGPGRLEEKSETDAGPDPREVTPDSRLGNLSEKSISLAVTTEDLVGQSWSSLTWSHGLTSPSLLSLVLFPVHILKMKAVCLLTFGTSMWSREKEKWEQRSWDWWCTKGKGKVNRWSLIWRLLQRKRNQSPGGYQRLDLFMKVPRVLCLNLTDAPEGFHKHFSEYWPLFSFPFHTFFIFFSGSC